MAWSAAMEAGEVFPSLAARDSVIEVSVKDVGEYRSEAAAAAATTTPEPMMSS